MNDIEITINKMTTLISIMKTKKVSRSDEDAATSIQKIRTELLTSESALIEYFVDDKNI